MESLLQNRSTHPGLLSDLIEEDYLPFASLKAFKAYCLVTLVLGLTLNIITVIVWSKGKHSGSELRIELTCLAVTDLLSAIFLPLFDGYIISSQRAAEGNDLVCRALGYIGHAIFYTSSLLNVLISLERLVVVYFPLRALRYTKTKKTAVLVFVFMLGCLHQIEYLLMTRRSCLVITLGAEIWNNVQLSISALVITISYTLIGIKILRQKVVGEGHLTSEHEKRKTQRKHQTIRMLAIDAGRILITLMMANIILSFTLKLISAGYVEVVIFARALMLSNVFSSPIVYLITSQAFRNDVIAILKSLRACMTEGKCQLPNPQLHEKSSTAAARETAKVTSFSKVADCTDVANQTEDKTSVCPD